MKRLCLPFAVACALSLTLAFSGSGKQAAIAPTALLAIKQEARNPWTSTNLKNDPADFQFVIVSDRTGGHRPGVFSQAVEKINLLQPEFVLSVGDLIEGGASKDQEKLKAEWTEFDGYVKRLQMPFFYVPGNHDYGAEKSSGVWKEKFGPSYYHFVYKDVLFLCLNTDDPPGSGAGHLSEEQVRFAKQTLEANPKVRWTIVAMHKPIWTSAKLAESGWLEVEAALKDRPYTVFVGHVHHYEKFVRNGRNYYQLATTGGSSKMRGLREREFDHIVWVTMKNSGPVMANVLIDSVLNDDLSSPVTKEAGVSTASRAKTHPVRGKLFLDGAPAGGARVVLQKTDPKTKATTRADGLVESDGTFTVSTYKANDGAPEGEFKVTATWRKAGDDILLKPGPNLLPAAYGNVDKTPLTVTIVPGQNQFEFNLETPKP